MLKLKPCLQCGSTDLSVEYFDDHIYDREHREYHYIRCNECGLEATPCGGHIRDIPPPEILFADLFDKFAENLILGGTEKQQQKALKKQRIDREAKTVNNLVSSWNTDKCSYDKSKWHHTFMKTYEVV